MMGETVLIFSIALSLRMALTIVNVKLTIHVGLMVISVTDLCIIHQSAIMMEEITIALSLMMASTIVNVKLTIHVGLMICVHLSNKMRCSSSRINYQIILLKTSAQKRHN